MSALSDTLRQIRRTATRRALPHLLGDRFDFSTVNRQAATHVALFPKLGIGYNRIKKNANSTTVSILTELETGLRLDDDAAKRRTPHLESAGWPTLLDARKFHFFVIVRDPYSRVLSAFLNRFSKDRYVSEFGSFAPDPKGFLDFLHWLGDGGLTADAHWDEQHKLIFAPLSAFDSVLKFEDFPDNLVTLLNARGVALTQDHGARIGSVNQATRTKASGKLLQFYTPEAEKRVTDLFKTDFDILPYERGLSGL